MIGDKGLTDTVLAEVDRALTAHELIKVKAAKGDRVARVAWLADICARLDAHPVQAIGKVLVLYRENPDKAADIAAKARQAGAPRSKPRPSGRASKPKRPRPRTAEELIRSARQRSRTPSPRPASALPKRRPRTSR
jgi:RNA-binding protein